MATTTTQTKRSDRNRAALEDRQEAARFERETAWIEAENAGRQLARQAQTILTTYAFVAAQTGENRGVMTLVGPQDAFRYRDSAVVDGVYAGGAWTVTATETANRKYPARAYEMAVLLYLERNAAARRAGGAN